MTITVQKIVDGRKNTVSKVTIAINADITNQVIFDASTFLTQSLDNKLVEIEYELNGFSAELFWDAAVPVPLMSLAKDKPFKGEYLQNYGGLINNAGSGKTGDILITTTGAAAGSNGHITLYIHELNVQIRG